jgi:hypothetical protein
LFAIVSTVDLVPAFSSGVAIAAIVVAAALAPAPTQSMTRLLEFSIVLTATLVVSSHTQRRYFVTLFVPVLALVAAAMQQRRGCDAVSSCGVRSAPRLRPAPCCR